MKSVTNIRIDKVMFFLRAAAVPILALGLASCATSSGSSCEKLAKNQKSEIRKMVKRFEKSASGRHVMLLETGSGVSDLCRTHFIGKEEYSALPESAEDYCFDQERPADTYCTIYSVDGSYTGQRVE